MVRLWCFLFGHQCYIEEYLSERAAKVTCARCRRRWAWHSEMDVAITWDREVEEFYRGFNG